MLNNVQLIHRLSIEERIKFIITRETLSNDKIGSYEFPVVTLNENPLTKDLGVTATILPTNSALSYSWNTELVEKINTIRGLESNALIQHSVYRLDSNIFNVGGLSEDPFLFGKMLCAQTRGLKEEGSFVCLDLRRNHYNSQQEIELLPMQMAMKENEYDVIIVDSFDELKYWREEYKYKGLVFAVAKNELDAVRYMNEGVVHIAYEGDYDRALEYIKEALRRYKNEKAKLDNKQISYEEYLEEIQQGKILPLENLNLICDKFLDFIFAIENNYQKYNNDVSEKIRKNPDKKVFEVEGHSEQAYKSAVESIVLLKNEGVLPLRTEVECAFLGDAFINYEYYRAKMKNDGTNFKTPLDLASSYFEINCKGFAHGYLKGKELEPKLIEKAKELASSVPTTVIYLFAEEDDYLPQEQIELVKEIAKTETKIIAVINASKLVDLSFHDLCSAIILTNDLGQEGPKAVLDVLAGVANPSGKLTHSYPLLVADAHDTKGIPLYQTESECILYPFGYGLSYTTFDYHHLEVKENGVNISITNNGDFAGAEIVQVYVQKRGSTTTLGKKNLKAFAKEFVEKGETRRIFIPFDENTFRYYNEERKGYGIEGGEYDIYVCDNSETIRVKGSIKIRPYLDEKRSFEVETEKLLSKEELKDFISNKPKIKGYKGKTFLMVLLMLYVTILGGFAAYVNFIQNHIVIGCLVLLILIVVVDVIVIVKMVKNKKLYIAMKKKYVDNNDENDTLTLMVDNLEDAIISKKQVFEIEELVPVEENENVEEIEQLEEVKEASVETPIEEVVEEVVEEVEEVVDISETILTVEEIALHEEEEIRLMEEQQKDLSGNEGFENYDKVVEFDTESSMSQMVSNFVGYAAYKGLTIDFDSARSLFSALGAARILVINTKIKELIPSFVEVLNDYLGNNAHIIEAQDQWLSSFNLTWKKEEDGTYTKTDFVNDVYNANRFKNNINVSILNNVSMKNVMSYLKEFVDSANYPSYPHSMRLNNKMALKIPLNFKVVIFPQDSGYLDEIPSELAEAAICLELLMRRNEDLVVEEVKPNCLSNAYFEDLIYEAKKTDYFSEESWKKFDALLEEISQTHPISLSNKSTLQIERFSSVYINAGGEEVDAVDSVFAEKIIPLLKTIPYYQTKDGVKALLTLVEKHLGHDNFNRTSRVLSSLLQE